MSSLSVFITAFITVIGLVGSIITIYEFFKSRQKSGSGKRQLVIGAVTTIVIVVASVILANILSLSDTTPKPVQPTHPPTPSDTSPFTGTGSGNTPVFYVGTDWSMVVSCTSVTTLEPGQFEIDVVDNSDNTIITPIYVETCAGTNGYEEFHVHQGGTVHLRVNAKADVSWKIQIR